MQIEGLSRPGSGWLRRLPATGTTWAFGAGRLANS
jgi:hypothetical protein